MLPWQKGTSYLLHRKLDGSQSQYSQGGEKRNVPLDNQPVTIQSDTANYSLLLI